MTVPVCSNYGIQFSERAAVCPQCGAPAPALTEWAAQIEMQQSRSRTRAIVTVVGVIAIGVIAFLACTKQPIGTDQRESEQVVAKWKERQAATERTLALSRLTDGNYSTAEDLLRDCTRIDPFAVAGSLSDSMRTKCGDAHIDAARKSLRGGDLAAAGAQIDLAAMYMPKSQEVSAIRDAISALKIIDRLKQIAEQTRGEGEKAVAQARLPRGARYAFGFVLRERFLSQGEDIKVRVSGQLNDRITLEWALFNDFRTHRMRQREGLMPEMKALGFRRVDVTDGHDYHVHWDVIQPITETTNHGERLSMDQRVAALIEQTLNGSTEEQAFAELESLGCAAVPAIIRRMDDHRSLPDPRITLRNKSVNAFEGLRHYGPKQVVDALAAILNQVTGQHFGAIYNGGTDALRADTVRGWREYLRKTQPKNLCVNE